MQYCSLTKFQYVIISAKTKKIVLDNLLPKDVENNLKHEIDSIIKHNEPLTEHTTKTEITQFLSKYKHENKTNSK